MSTDLVHVDAQSHTFDLLGPAADLAERIARTDFVPDALKGRPDAVMAAILKGHELGMAPMQALSQIAVIKGKPTVSAEGQRALVLAAGHDIQVKDMTPTKCTLVGTRSGASQSTTVTYTMDEAKKAGIARGNAWQNYPTEMLLARCTTRLCRAVFADVIGGLSATEEVVDLDESEAGDTPGTVKRKAPARKKTAAKKAEPTPESVFDAEPAADLPPLPHELDDEVVDAEIVEDKPFTDEDRTLEYITPKQLKMVGALFTAAGIKDRADRLAYASDIAGRELATSKDLTKAEASKLIDDLQALEAAAPAQEELL